MSDQNNNSIQAVCGDVTPLEKQKKSPKQFLKSVIRKIAKLCKLSVNFPCAAIAHIIKKIWAFLRKNKDPNAYENLPTFMQVLQSKYPEDLALFDNVCQKLREWALNLWDYINTEVKIWNIIKYVPILNIIYGIGRIIHYIILSLKTDDADIKDEYRKEVIRSATTIIGGILALLLAGPISSLASVIPGLTLSAAVTFAVEMVAGAFIQNIFIFIGETCSIPWEELNQMNGEEWETWINSEVFMKTPFLGTLYSCFQAIVYFLKGNVNEGLLSLADGALNAVWSFGMLFMSMSCHPSLSNTPLYKWLNRQLYDDLVRTFTLLGRTLTPEVSRNLLQRIFKFFLFFHEE